MNRNPASETLDTLGGVPPVASGKTTGNDLAALGGREGRSEPSTIDPLEQTDENGDIGSSSPSPAAVPEPSPPSFSI